MPREPVSENILGNQKINFDFPKIGWARCLCQTLGCVTVIHGNRVRPALWTGKPSCWWVARCSPAAIIHPSCRPAAWWLIGAASLFPAFRLESRASPVRGTEHCVVHGLLRLVGSPGRKFRDQSDDPPVCAGGFLETWAGHTSSNVLCRTGWPWMAWHHRLTRLSMDAREQRSRETLGVSLRSSRLRGPWMAPQP